MSSRVRAAAAPAPPLARLGSALGGAVRARRAVHQAARATRLPGHAAGEPRLLAPGASGVGGSRGNARLLRPCLHGPRQADHGGRRRSSRTAPAPLSRSFARDCARARTVWLANPYTAALLALPLALWLPLLTPSAARAPPARQCSRGLRFRWCRWRGVLAIECARPRSRSAPPQWILAGAPCKRSAGAVRLPACCSLAGAGCSSRRRSWRVRPNRLMPRDDLRLTTRGPLTYAGPGRSAAPPRRLRPRAGSRCSIAGAAVRSPDASRKRAPRPCRDPADHGDRGLDALASAGRHAEAQLVVLAAGRGKAGAQARSGCHRRDAGASGSASRSISSTTPLLGDDRRVAREAVGEVDHRVDSRAPRAPALRAGAAAGAAWRAISACACGSARSAAVEQLDARRPRRPASPVTPTRSPRLRAVATDDRVASRPSRRPSP